MVQFKWSHVPGLLVAPMMNTCFLATRPSISVRSWFTTRELALPCGEMGEGYRMGGRGKGGGGRLILTHAPAAHKEPATTFPHKRKRISKHQPKTSTKNINH